jgi:hypothetical protein
MVSEDDDPRPAAVAVRAAKTKRLYFRAYRLPFLGLLLLALVAAVLGSIALAARQTRIPDVSDKVEVLANPNAKRATLEPPRRKSPEQPSTTFPEGACAGVIDRELPSCVSMPPQSALRIAIAALPPEAYTKKAPAGGNLAAAPVGDAAWLNDAFRAAWDFTTLPYEPWSHLDFSHSPPSLAQMRDALMSVDIPDDVERPPPDRSAPILNSGRLKQAVALASARLARLAVMQPAFTFTSQSQRDLERIVIANMLSSPYATIVDLRATTMQELKTYDLVFVPFPLISMRDNPKMAVRFQDIMVSLGV